MTRHRIVRALAPVGAALVIALACDNDVSSPPTSHDEQPPQPIDDLALAYDSLSNTVVFTWTARGDDLAHPRADHYDLRYGAAFPFDWEQSIQATGTPAPTDAGTIQHFVLDAPARGRDLYASLRAVDAAGNESRAGNVAHQRVPGFILDATCLDALTRAPIAGIDAFITTRRADHIVTAADGRIHLADLAGGTLGVLLTRGSAPVSYHTFNDAFVLAGDLTTTFPMIPFQKPVSPLYASILELLKAGLLSPGGDPIIKRWATYPVPWYAPDFVNGNGIDYRALAAQAAERWNTRLGFEMFAPVASDPATGILLEFLPRSTMGTVNGVTDYANDAQGYPVHDRIQIVDDMTDAPRLYSIFMHELGHTIPLQHLPAGFIMYGSQPLPGDISDDEVAMVKLLLALPNGTRLTKFDETPPAP